MDNIGQRLAGCVRQAVLWGAIAVWTTKAHFPLNRTGWGYDVKKIQRGGWGINKKT
jgi:hypothetical protein